MVISEVSIFPRSSMQAMRICTGYFTVPGSNLFATCSPRNCRIAMGHRET